MIEKAGKFGPITEGMGRRSMLTAPNIATTVSSMRAHLPPKPVYLSIGREKGMDGLEAFFESETGAKVVEDGKESDVVFLHAGKLEEALKRLKPSGVLVVIGIGTGKPMRDEWMRVRNSGSVILCRFHAPTLGPDRTGDVGVGSIGQIQSWHFGVDKNEVKNVKVNLKPEPKFNPVFSETSGVVDVKQDGRRGGRVR
jgi:hypothetical protein